MRQPRPSRKLPSFKEWEILAILDRRETPRTAREILGELPVGPGWELSTVKTVLGRMKKSGLVKSHKKGYTTKSLRLRLPVAAASSSKVSVRYVGGYTPVYPKEELFGEGLLSFIVETIFDDDPVALAKAIIKHQNLSEVDRNEIRRLLRDYDTSGT